MQSPEAVAIAAAMVDHCFRQSAATLQERVHVGNSKVIGGTNAWQLSSCTPRTTLAVFLEVGPVGNQRIPDGKLLHLQFQTAYQHPSGQQRLRVSPEPIMVVRSSVYVPNAEGLQSGLQA